jgi:hypothetical protein
MFTVSVAAFDPAAPLAPTITLGANASLVAAPLTLEVLLEAKYQMENATETFSTVDRKTGAIKHDNIRKRPITGYMGSTYLVLMGKNGYRQLMSDERFRSQYVVNGGFAAQGMVSETLGIDFPLFGLKFQVLDNPLTISKEVNPKLSSDGNLALEVAYVIGGGVSPVGIELSLDGYTKMIDIPYNDSRKLDPFELLSIHG